MQLFEVLRRFGLELVSDDGRALSSGVSGAHALEIADPIRFVPPGWILLSSCMRLYRRPDLQRELIRELHAGGVAALGFGVGVTFDRPPQALLQEAERLGFPVFEVPEVMPFREIIRYVDAELLGHDLQTLRRSVSIHDQMMADLAGSEPEVALVRTLSRMLRCSAALIAPTGEVVAESEAAGGQRIWRLLGDIVEAEVEHATRLRSTDDLVAVPVLLDRRVVAWLAAALTERSLELPMVERAAAEAASMLALFHRALSAVEAERRQDRSTSFRDLLSTPQFASGGASQLPRNTARVLPRVDRSEGGLVTVVRPDDPARADRLSEEVEIVLSSKRLTFMVTHVIDEVVIWSSRPVDLAPVLESAGMHSWSVGVGGVARADDEVRRSYLEARLAARAAARRGSRATVAFGELGMIDSLLVDADEMHATTSARLVLRGLEGQHDLQETLLAFLDSGLSASETARRLHLHKNSLRYRVQRIESLLGRDLHDPEDIAEVFTALTVRRLFAPGPLWAN
jgi:purine catabolism regulator